MGGSPPQRQLDGLGALGLPRVPLPIAAGASPGDGVLKEGSIAAHIGASVPAPSAALSTPGSGKVLLSDDEVKTFLQRGWHILEGPKLRLPDGESDSDCDLGVWCV